MKTKEIVVIARKLSPYLPGFVLKGKFMFSSPADDFVRGLFFEDAFDPTAFYLRMLFLPLFIPRDCISFIHGERIGNDLNWTIENPKLIDNLLEAINGEAVPFFESVSTLRGLLAYVKRDVESDWPRYNSHHLEELAYLYIKVGEYAAAFESLGRLKRDLEKETIPWIVAQRDRAQLLETKLSESPEAALAQLETWRKQTIIKLGL